MYSAIKPCCLRKKDAFWDAHALEVSSSLFYHYDCFDILVVSSIGGRYQLPNVIDDKSTPSVKQLCR